MASNGGEHETEASLPERRKAAVAAGLEQYNHVANERDRFEAQVRELQAQIAGYKVALEANDARIGELESRAKSAVIERDRAIADRTKYEALFVSIKAQLRAFNVPNEPLIRDMSEEADRAMDYLRHGAQQQQAAQAQTSPYPPQQPVFPGGIGGIPDRTLGGSAERVPDPKRSP